MIKKVIGFNGSPRKGWNTDLLVKSCLQGAKDAGAEIKMYQISDLKKLKPCQSCLVCKQSVKTEGRCVIKDDLTPILEEIKRADALIIGSPNYFGNVSSAIHVALERILFSNVSYQKDKPSAFGKKIKTGFIMPMNVDKNISTNYYKYDWLFNHIKNTMATAFGECEFLPVYNTIQVADYSKYNITCFDIPQKLKDRKEKFPDYLELAYKLGQKLVQ